MRHSRAFVVAVVSSAVPFSTVVLSQGDAKHTSGPGIPQAASSRAKAKQSIPQPNWMVKYVAGSIGLKSNQWLRIDILLPLESGQITNPSVLVPVEHLIAVEFSARTERESALLQGPRSGCSYAPSMMPDTTKGRPAVLVATRISPGPLDRWAESLRSKHSVRFVWRDAGEQKSMTVSVHDCEYQSFIANVRWIVGARWKEIRREIK